MKKVATIILNRNLPGPTNQLYRHLKKFDHDHTDIYILEAGSDKSNLSKYYTWYADSPYIVKNGLRYGRGMNYALLQLYKENKWSQYDYFFLLTNDTELRPTKTIAKLVSILKYHKRVGILSPCSKKWGEQYLLKNQKTKYFWYIHNNAFLIRREFLDLIIERKKPNLMNFVFDGQNFRGYLSESEIIAKAYANDWAAAISTEVFAEENESYLLEKSDLIKTEDYNDNLKLYLSEGKHWLRKKYGFNSHWLMHQYVKNFYENFFENNPSLINFKI